MPVFSCGGMRYQQAWQDLSPTQIDAAGQANLAATIERALALGINHIETARGYGSSEMQLGWVLPQYPRQDLIVQTKVGPAAEVADFERDFEQSMGYLKLDYVDLLGIHGINTREHLDWTLRPGGCLDRARRWQAEGRVRFIGFSTHGPLDVIMETIQSNQFDYVNLHWYYINQTNWRAIEAATQLDMGVFIISPANKGGLLYEPSPKLVELCKPLSPMVFNNLFCLSHPQVHTLSLGAARPSDFDEHLKTLSFLDQPGQLLPMITRRLEQAAIEAFDREFGPGEGKAWLRTWEQGLPKPEEVPGEISVRTIVWLWNLVKAFDMVAYGKMRYNLLGNGGHWFPGQRGDRLSELDLRPCLAHSPYPDRVLNILTEAHQLLAGGAVKRLSQSS